MLPSISKCQGGMSQEGHMQQTNRNRSGFWTERLKPIIKQQAICLENMLRKGIDSPKTAIWWINMGATVTYLKADFKDPNQRELTEDAPELAHPLQGAHIMQANSARPSLAAHQCTEEHPLNLESRRRRSWSQVNEQFCTVENACRESLHPTLHSTLEVLKF